MFWFQLIRVIDMGLCSMFLDTFEKERNSEAGPWKQKCRMGLDLDIIYTILKVFSPNGIMGVL